MTARDLRIARLFLRGGEAGFALTVLALALGVAVVCAIDLANRAVLRSFVEIVDTMAGRAALEVRPAQGGAFSEDVTGRVVGIPGVELAVPVVSGTAFTVDGSGELLTILGVDVASDAAVRVYQARDASGLELDDPLMFLAQPDSIALTRDFATRRHLEVGDELALDTPQGRRPFTVRGFLEPEGVARVYGGNLAVMDLYAAEAAFTRPGLINRIDVVVRRDRDVGGVAVAISAALPAGLLVEAPAQRRADLHRVMHSAQVLLQGAGLLGLVAAFLIAFSRLATVFERRAWQLGVLRAIGVRARRLWSLLLVESMLVGGVGVVLGLPLGIGLGHLVLPLIATTTSLSANLVAPAGALSVSALSLLLAASLGLSAAMLAAALPAWRVSRVAVSESARSRGSEQRVSTRWPWVIRATSATALTGAIYLQTATGSGSWGLVASGLIVVAGTLAARPLLSALQAPATAALRTLPDPAARLALGILVANPRRTALAVATSGVGFGMVLWLWTLAASFEQSVVNAMPGVLHGDLSVSSTHMASGYVEAPVDGAILDELRAVGGIAEVAGLQSMPWQYGGGPITINAFDPHYFDTSAFGDWKLIGRHDPRVLESVARGEAAIVSSNFALNLHVDVGDTISLDTPGGPLTLAVGGVVMDFISSRGAVEMSRDVYRRHWNDGLITRAIVRIAPGARVEDVRAAIAARLGERYGLMILSFGEVMRGFARDVRRAFSGLHVLAGMVLFVVLVGMADTLASSVVERASELGAMRALGVRRRTVGRLILWEAFFLGVLGFALALVIGLGLGVLWVETTFPLLLGWVLELHVPWVRAAVVGIVSLMVCALAALLPARHAAALEPAVALRYE